jgi:hypothetical protein
MKPWNAVATAFTLSLLERCASQARFPTSRSRWWQAWTPQAAALLLSVYSAMLFSAGRWTKHSQTATEQRSTLHPLGPSFFAPIGINSLFQGTSDW